jgi:hypothetical protein
MKIIKPEGKIWFLASCVELYKEEKNMSGKEVFNYFKMTGAYEFITNCWEGLHMTSPSYIVESIDEFIINNK